MHNDATAERSSFWPYWWLIGALLLGLIVKAKPDFSPNDKSRWNTVWSLVEFNTYQMFDTPADAKQHGRPLQFKTIDKIVVADKSYSTKPPLLPTVIAQYVKLVKAFVQKPFTKDETPEGGGKPIPGSIHWYAPAVLILFQMTPLLLMLWVYRRYLDEQAKTVFGWWTSLLTAGLGTYLTGYVVTLNNHTIAGSFALITAYLAHTIVYQEKLSAGRFLLTGLCAGWTAANELPAALFCVLLFALLWTVDRKRTLLAYTVGVVIVAAGFFYTNYQVVQDFKPAYLIRQHYKFPGSYWADETLKDKRSSIDQLNDADKSEDKLTYFMHMTVGHHGVFSLTPIWLIALLGAWIWISEPMSTTPAAGKGRPLGLHLITAITTVVVFCFYWLVNSERNYGGFCHGMRWLMWLGGLWLLFLPAGLDRLATSKAGRTFAAVCLGISVFSVVETWPGPWSYSWLHNLMLNFGWVSY